MADDTGFEVLGELDELRARLTRGGLPPEAVTKAVEAYELGEIAALNFAIGKNGAFNLIVPKELLVRVFPTLGESPPTREDYVEYSINRHRGGRKSLTLRWPDSLGSMNGNGDEEEPEPTVAARVSPSRDRKPEAAESEDPWPG